MSDEKRENKVFRCQELADYQRILALSDQEEEPIFFKSAQEDGWHFYVLMNMPDYKRLLASLELIRELYKSLDSVLEHGYLTMDEVRKRLSQAIEVDPYN